MSVAHSAFYHVASGLFDVVLAVGSEKMLENDPQGTMTTVSDPFFQRSFIGGAAGAFAAQVSGYSNRYNLPEDRVRQAACPEITGYCLSREAFRYLPCFRRGLCRHLRL